MADKVTAAAITVIVAGTVSVGAVAIRHTQKPSKAVAGDRVARSGPHGAARSRRTPVTAKPVVKPHHKPHHKPDHATPGSQGQTGRRSRRDADRLPGPDRPQPHSGAAGDSSSAASGARVDRRVHGVGGPRGASLAFISQHVTGQHSDQMLFGEVVQGDLVDGHGKTVGTVYLDFGGSIAGGERLAVQPLAVDRHPRGAVQVRGVGQPPVCGAGGRRRFDHVRLRGASSASRAFPRRSIHPVPHDGTISISLGFWGDGRRVRRRDAEDRHTERRDGARCALRGDRVHEARARLLDGTCAGVDAESFGRAVGVALAKNQAVAVRPRERVAVTIDGTARALALLGSDFLAHAVATAVRCSARGSGARAGGCARAVIVARAGNRRVETAICRTGTSRPRDQRSSTGQCSRASRCRS